MQFIFYLLKKSIEAYAPNKHFILTSRKYLNGWLNTKPNKFKYYKLKKYDCTKIWNIYKLKHCLSYLPLLDVSLHAQAHEPQINVFTEATLWEKNNGCFDYIAI